MLCDYRNCPKPRYKELRTCQRHKHKLGQIRLNEPSAVKNTPLRTIPQLGVSVKNRNDYADYDYVNTLTHKDLRWLKGFHREFVNADFKHNYEKLHKSKKERKDCYNRNNARGRDLYGLKKTLWELYFCSNIGEESNKVEWPSYPNPEDYIIALIDSVTK